MRTAKVAVSTDSFYASESLTDILDPEVFGEADLPSKKIENIVVEVVHGQKRFICDLNSYDRRHVDQETLTFSTPRQNVNPFLWKDGNLPKISVLCGKETVWSLSSDGDSKELTKMTVDFMDNDAIITIETKTQETDNQ